MCRGLIKYLPVPITCTGAVLLRLPTFAGVLFEARGLPSSGILASRFVDDGLTRIDARIVLC